MTDQQGFKRQLGVGPAAAMGIGGMIGVGIFLVPAGMTRSLGSPFLLLIVWLVMAGMALSGALCYGELASRYPDAGGGYVYLREAFGPQTAFLYGWMSLMVMDPGITATLATGMAGYADHVVPLGAVGMKTLAIAVILVLAGINIRGVRFGAGFILALVILKIGVLALIALWGFGSGHGDWSNFLPFVTQRPGSAPLLSALASGLVGAFFAFAGWWDVTKVAGEVRDPARTLPRALALAVVLVMVTYVVTSAVFIYLVPVTDVTSDEAFAAQAGEVLFGHRGGVIFSTVVVLSVAGSIAGLLMAAPRVYYAMARDGVFLRFAGAIHPRFGTPYRAIAIQGILACLLVFFVGTFQVILNYVFFVAVLFIGISVASIFRIRYRSSDIPSYQTPAYPLTPLVFLVLIAILLVLLLGNSPKEALLGTLVVALGIPVYHLAFKSGERQQTEEG